jgi:hypothetical protein
VSTLKLILDFRRYLLSCCVSGSERTFSGGE